MAISRANMLKELLPGLNGLFGLEYNTYENQHADMFSEESSDRSFEEEQKLSGFGAAGVKGEGEGVNYDETQEAWAARYVMETISAAFAITEEAVEDGLYGSISARATKALARSMAYTKQVKAAAVLNNGFTTFTSGDGVSLFNASHPLISGGVNANVPAAGVDLSETAIEAASIQIALWTDERGLLIASKPRKLCVPAALMHVATRILKTEYRVGTADNDISSINYNGTVPEGHCVNHHLTDPKAWFLKTDVPDGLKYFNRVALSTGMDGDFDTGNVRYKARERYAFGVTDPLGVWGSPGA